MEESISKIFTYLVGAGILALVATAIKLMLDFAVLKNDVKHIVHSFDAFTTKSIEQDKRLTKIEIKVGEISKNTKPVSIEGKING